MKELCLDFDGVIHSYTSGWTGEANVADGPVPGALEFLRKAVQEFEVSILSTRSGSFEGRRAMRAWLRYEAGSLWSSIPGEPGLDRVKFPISKPPAFVTLDDRALNFTGTFPEIEDLKNFKPWQHQDRTSIDSVEAWATSLNARSLAAWAAFLKRSRARTAEKGQLERWLDGIHDEAFEYFVDHEPSLTTTLTEAYRAGARTAVGLMDRQPPTSQNQAMSQDPSADKVIRINCPCGAHMYTSLGGLSSGGEEIPGNCGYCWVDPQKQREGEEDAH